MAAFGLFLPQEDIPWNELQDKVTLIDRLGFDSMWLNDHFYPPGSPKGTTFEAWTAAAALAAVTERVRLGHLVLCNSFRHPALLAKIVASLDLISNGRVNLGIGSGSVPAEHDVFGVPFPSPRKRSKQLDEALEVMKLLFTQDETSFAGEFFQLEAAPAMPKPVQRPHPPILVGGSGEQFTLPIVARRADAWNCPPHALGELEHKIGALRAECGRIGRDPATLRISTVSVIALTPRRQDVDAALAEAHENFGSPGWGFEAGGLAGTPDDVVRQIEAKIEVGVDLFILRFADGAKPETLELFAREVAPAFGQSA